MAEAPDATQPAPWGVERSLSYARWVAAAFVFVQGTLIQPGPQARSYLIPATFGLGGLLVAANLALLPSLRRGRIARPTAFAMFAVDVFVVCATVWLYLDQPAATQWVLFLIVQLEAAYRYDMRGAVGTALFASVFYALVRYNAAQEFGFPLTVDSITYVLGLTLVQGLVVGGMASRLHSERDASLQLHEAALQLNADLDRQEILSALAEETVRVMQAGFAIVWLPDGDGFSAAGRSKLPTSVVEPLWLPALDPVFGESSPAVARRTGQPVWAPDPAHGRYGPPALEGTVLPRTWRSVCSVPIPLEGSVVGVLSCYLEAVSHPNPDDTARLQALAALAGVAMANASAYERERSTLEDLRTLDRLKDDFLSTVSHELRTPLTVIAGFASTLRERWDDVADDRRRDLVGRIETQASDLDDRIRDLLDFSRLQSGMLNLTPGRLHVAPFVQETVSRLEPTLAGHQVDLHAPDDLEAWFDATALGQVLDNLLINAARYSPEGAPITVTVEESDDGWVDLAVTDRGIGIPADEQPHVFERFYRGQQDEVRRVRGTGIGLAIVKELTEAMEGTVLLSSERGRGSTFTVRLPGPASPAPEVVGEPAPDGARSQP